MRGTQPWHQTPWDWRASIQFICGGAGTGLLLFTAIAAFFLEGEWLLRTGFLALLFIGIGLTFVWLKLGRRWRALFVFLNPQTSWMTREAFLSLPMVVLALAAILLRSPRLGLVAALFGLGFLYAQARILRASMGVPAWREPLIVPLIVSTGLVEGASLLLIAAALIRTAGLWLPVALFLLLITRLWVWSMYRIKLTEPGAAPLSTAAVLNDNNLTLTVLGHVVPLILLIGAVFMPDAAAILGAAAGLAALFAGWYLKFTIINRAAYNQGFAIDRTPARTPGYSGPGARPGWR